MFVSNIPIPGANLSKPFGHLTCDMASPSSPQAVLRWFPPRFFANHDPTKHQWTKRSEFPTSASAGSALKWYWWYVRIWGTLKNHSKVGNHLLGLHLLRPHLYRNEGYLQAVAILLAGKKRSTPQLNAKPNVVSKIEVSGAIQYQCRLGPLLYTSTKMKRYYEKQAFHESKSWKYQTKFQPVASAIHPFAALLAYLWGRAFPPSLGS